jgi:hypothetical protein
MQKLSLTAGVSDAPVGTTRLVLCHRNAANGQFYVVNVLAKLATPDEQIGQSSVTLVAGLTVQIGSILYNTGNGYDLADGNDLAKLQDVVIATSAGDTSVTIMEYGYFQGAAGLTPGLPVYVQPSAKAVKTVTVGVNPVEGAILTVGSQAFTFTAGTPSTNQIQIGADVNTTAQNIFSVVSGVSSDITKCTAAVATNVVTLTGVTEGVDFVCTSGDSNVVIATTVPSAEKGHYTQTAPSVTGKWVQCIGWATTGTTIKFMPDTLAVQI